MRYPPELRELDPLGVYEDHLDLPRVRSEQQRGQQPVEHHALAAPRGPRDEQMRHLGEVEEYGPPRDVFAQSYRKGPVVRVGVGPEDVPERHLRRPGIGYFDPDRALARYRGEYPDLGRRQGIRYVLLQVPDLADLDPATETQLVSGNPRANHGAHHVGLHPEIGERQGEPLARTFGVVLGIPMPQTQHRKRRRCVLAGCKLPLRAEALLGTAIGQDDLELSGRRAL